MADLVTIWVVTPHESHDFDEWWGPCETDEDHDAAVEYAQDRLTDLWDQYDSKDPRPVTVTMEQRDVCREDFGLSQEQE